LSGRRVRPPLSSSQCEDPSGPAFLAYPPGTDQRHGIIRHPLMLEKPRHEHGGTGIVRRSPQSHRENTNQPRDRRLRPGHPPGGTRRPGRVVQTLGCEAVAPVDVPSQASLSLKDSRLPRGYFWRGDFSSLLRPGRGIQHRREFHRTLDACRQGVRSAPPIARCQ